MDVDRSLLAGQYAPEGRLVTLRTDNKVVGYLGICLCPATSTCFSSALCENRKVPSLSSAWRVIILAAAFSMLLASRMIKP